MPHEARWDRTNAGVAADLAGAAREGARVVSLTSYGDPDDPRHAIVIAWRGDPVAQRFEADVAPGLAAGVLARHARDGFHPALVGMTGPADRPRLAFVLERSPPGAAPPRFVPPRPFRDEEDVLFVTRAAGDGPRDAGYLAHLAAAGAPRDATGAGLLVAGIWAPQSSPRVAWAVHLDPIDAMGPWRDRREPRALEAVARPVVALPVLGPGGASWVLSLWHDRVIEPWPAPDPFAPARRFEADEAPSGEEMDRRLARRAAEGRAPIALGAARSADAARFLTLHGALESRALPRCFVALSPGDPAPEVIAPGAGADTSHPLDRWALDHLCATGARHGQLVVVRGRRLAFARAYTYAEPGYPVARFDHALRLGSVSKALTAIALFAVLARRDVPGGLEARVVDLLGFSPGEGPPRLARVTLRHLLTHHAGLRTFTGVRPDEPDHPLSEHAITARLTGAPGPARPGMLSLALRALRDDACFARDPGSGAPDYSNEGFILLGEIVAHLARGEPAEYEAALADLVFRPAGVDPGDRGLLFGAGRERALARRESPAHPTSPTWREDRFGSSGAITLSPYGDNGPFLGGAAGVAVPLLWLARVLAALGPRADGSGLIPRIDADLAAAHGLGFVAGEPGFWPLRHEGGATLPIPVLRLAHNGRLDGGSALLMHQFPRDARDDALDATLSVAVAFNHLGPLYEDPHGRRLLSILRGIEAGPLTTGWHARDLFGRG